MNRHVSRSSRARVVLIVGAALLPALGARGQAPPVVDPSRGIPLPETPQREDAPGWRLPPGYELPKDESDPLHLWIQGLRDMAAVMLQVGELDREQERLVAEVQAHQRDIQTRTGTFPDFRQRAKMRELISQLHANQQGVQEANASVMAIVRRLVPKAAEVRKSLAPLRDRWAELAEEKTGGSGKGPRSAAAAGRYRDRLTQTIAVLEEIETGTKGKTGRLLSDMRSYFSGKGARSRGFVTQRLAERLERLEREQKLMRQALEANERELGSVRRQLERLVKMQMRQRWRGDPDEEDGSTLSGPPPEDGAGPGAVGTFRPPPRRPQQP